MKKLTITVNEEDIDIEVEDFNSSEVIGLIEWAKAVYIKKRMEKKWKE